MSDQLRSNRREADGWSRASIVGEDSGGPCFTVWWPAHALGQVLRDLAVAISERPRSFRLRGPISGIVVLGDRGGVVLAGGVDVEDVVAAGPSGCRATIRGARRPGTSVRG